MSKKLFVLAMHVFFKEHIARLEEAGFKISKLDSATATQDDVVEAIKDADAVLLGGWDQGTKRVFDAAGKLKIIVFPGIGYQKAIPDWKYALEKGIVISNTPDAPTNATAEWSLAAALAMSRGLFEVGLGGPEQSKIMQGLEGSKIGIYAFGRIGKRIASMVSGFNPESISYCSSSRHPEIEDIMGINYKEEEALFKESDVIFIAAPDSMEEKYFSDRLLERVKPGAVVVSISRIKLFDYDAVARMLDRGVVMAQDDPVEEMATKYPKEKWFTNQAHNAFNTEGSLRSMGDAATETIIKFFETGEIIDSISK